MQGKPKNPFTENLEIRAIKVLSEREFWSKDDWSESDGVRVPNVIGGQSEHSYKFSYLMESEKGGKLYRNEKTEEVLKKLSDRGCRMLLFILRKLPKDSDLVEIVPDEYKSQQGLSSIQTVYNTLRDLIDMGVLAKHKTNRYWINPAIIFNGNRAQKFSDKVVIDAIIPAKKK